MKCDMDCPHGDPHCCRGCSKSRKDLKDIYPDRWTDKHGFWSHEGCRLGDDRPQECKDYDCKQYVFYYTTAYVDGRWKILGFNEVLKSTKIKDLVETYNDLFREYK